MGSCVSLMTRENIVEAQESQIILWPHVEVSSSENVYIDDADLTSQKALNGTEDSSLLVGFADVCQMNEDSSLLVGAGDVFQTEDHVENAGWSCAQKLFVVLLVCQNVISLMVTKIASRIPAPDGHVASVFVVVSMAELLKVCCCILEIVVRRKGLAGFVSEIRQDMFRQDQETFLLLIPSMLYALQNNLHFLAVKHLEPPLVIVIAQLKILTTAIFSVLILRKLIKTTQWACLVVLFFGCCATQLQISERHVDVGLRSGNVAISIRNLQLGLPSFLIGISAGWTQSSRETSVERLFQGFTSWTWCAVVLHSCGGLITASVMKHLEVP